MGTSVVYPSVWDLNESLGSAELLHPKGKLVFCPCIPNDLPGGHRAAWSGTEKDNTLPCEGLRIQTINALPIVFLGTDVQHTGVKDSEEFRNSWKHFLIPRWSQRREHVCSPPSCQIRLETWALSIFLVDNTALLICKWERVVEPLHGVEPGDPGLEGGRALKRDTFSSFCFNSLGFYKASLWSWSTTASHLVSFPCFLVHLATTFSCIFNGTQINMAVLIF